MDLLLYFFVLTTAILSIALIHIYYKLTDNSYVLDFFTFRVVSFLYSLLFIMTMIPSFEAMKITLTKLSIYSDIIGGIIFMFFLYESILSKEFSSRYKYFFTNPSSQNFTFFKHIYHVLHFQTSESKELKISHYAPKTALDQNTYTGTILFESIFHTHK